MSENINGGRGLILFDTLFSILHLVANKKVPPMFENISGN